MKANLLLSCAVLSLGLYPAAFGATCNPVAIPALDQGWYDTSGMHGAYNQNYFCGDGGGGDSPLRNWFAFNVPVLSQPVASAALRIFTYSVSTSDASETYELRDVTTPVGTLIAGGNGLTNVFADLGEGTVYGSRTILNTESSQFITIPLNAAFVSNFTAAAGGMVALGGQLTTLDGIFNNNEYIFGNSGLGSLTNPSVQLLLTYSNGNALSIVQEPVSQYLLAGDTANFSVQVCGGGPPGYQWQRFGTNLSGATSPTLQLLAVVPAQSGPYRAVVTDGITTVTSQVATLTVSNGIPPSTSIYISYGQSPTLADCGIL